MIFRSHIWERRYFVPHGLEAAMVGLNIASQSQKAQAEAAQASYKAQVARNAQALAEINARNAEAQGDAAIDRQRLKTAQVIGKQRSALAAQGGDVNSGSNLDVLGDTSRAGETDAASIRNDAAWKAYGYRVQGLNAGAEASDDDFQGANAMAALPYGVASSLLGSAQKITSRWASTF